MSDEDRPDWFGAGGDDERVRLGGEVAEDFGDGWFDRAEPFPTELAASVESPQRANGRADASTATATRESSERPESSESSEPSGLTESRAGQTEPGTGAADPSTVQMDGEVSPGTDVSAPDEPTARIDANEPPADVTGAGEADERTATVSDPSESRGQPSTRATTSSQTGTDDPAESSDKDSGGLVAWLRSILGL